jgi:hypothetical protein
LTLGGMIRSLHLACLAWCLVIDKMLFLVGLTTLVSAALVSGVPSPGSLKSELTILVSNDLQGTPQFTSGTNRELMW